MESPEVYKRLGELEREVHTLNFRVESVEDANLGNRVMTLEGSVANISKNVDKMELMAVSIKDDVSSMKAWSKGVAITLSALSVIFGLLISFGGLFT